MSKIEKWWQHVSFYNKIKATATGVVALIETKLLISEADAKWHYLSIGLGVIALIITHWFQDNNNNGKVDFMERKKRTK